MPRLNRRVVVALHDIGIAAVAWQLAWLARFNFTVSYRNWDLSLWLLPEILLIQALLFWYFGLYRGLWRFASIPDLWNIIRVAVLGALTISLVLFLQLRMQGIPRSVLLLYPVFLIVLLGGPRLGYRLWRDHGLNPGVLAGGQRVLLVGAGRAGEMLARDMLREGQYCPIGFLDDDPNLRHTRVHGLPVFGSVEASAGVVEAHDIDLIVITIPSATGRQMQRIVEYAEQAGCPLRTLPGLQDMVAGRPGVGDLRDLSIEDLLGRNKVELDWQVIQQGISQQVILVSGGGGSIGAELCRQVARLGPARLVILEQSEFNLYRTHRELTQAWPSLGVDAVLGDVSDAPTVDWVLARYKPSLIFHAAAYKHVPILENQIREAVRNNVIGTLRLAEAAERHGCEKFVLISTDKAVNPINLLGKTKRVAEILCDSMNRRANTRFVTVRFGNVLGSDGSVVPLFQEQIRSGGPVTVTHPDMQRYFMMIPEACQLILQASVMGGGGEVFVLDMGKPIRIAYLAEQMIRLSGRVPGRDIEIRFTRPRPGEKLDEELFYDDECMDATSHPKILLARHQTGDQSRLKRLLQELVEASERYDELRLQAILDELVPVAPQQIAADSKVIPIRTPQASS